MYYVCFIQNYYNDFSSVLVFRPSVPCQLSVCYGNVLRILARGMQCGGQ